jgi:hypothetical protein
MSGVNPDYDPWDTEELINRYQLNGANRSIQNFVMDGLGLTDAGGLLLEVGAGFAYIVGYEVELASPDFVALTDAATNYIFFGFTRTPDAAPPTSVLDIVVDIVVNTSGISPGSDYVLLGTVDTAGGIIVVINANDLRKFFGPAQFSENIEANHNQINNLVVDSGAALPPAGPPSVEGQLFFRTTDKELFKNVGGAWVVLAAAALPAPPGAIPGVNGGVDLLDVGEVVRADPGMPGQVIRASAATEAEAFAIGAVVTAPIPPAAPGDIGTIQGILIPDVQFEAGLAGVVTGALVYLSVLTPGAATVTDPVISPAIVGTARKVIGTVWDGSGYTGIPPFTKASILLQIEEATVIS